MSVNTMESLLEQIATLPITEKKQLVTKVLESLHNAPAERTNGGQQHSAKPKHVFVKPIPQPDPEPNYRWMREHAHEFGGQWVALDGDRLIAHSEDADAVFAAARADGAYLPLVTFVIPADAPPFIGV
jgi:Family of unknown function (DUF5678)